jgi:hypothetical protein
MIGALAGRLDIVCNKYGSGRLWATTIIKKKKLPGQKKHDYSYKLAAKWLSRQGGYLAECEVHGGAYYCFTRDTFEKMGGFIESEGTQGFFEFGLAIQSRFTGVPSYIHQHVKVPHLYRSPKLPVYIKAGYPRETCQKLYAQIECLRVMFRPDIWKRIFEPLWRRHKLDGKSRYLLDCHQLGMRQAAFEHYKVVSDEEVVKWMGLGSLLEVL